MQRSRRGSFILISVALHVLVLGLGWWNAQKADVPKALPPVVMEIRTVESPKPVEAPKPMPVAPKPRVAVKQAEAQPETAVAEAKPEAPKDARPSAESFAPREIKTGGATLQVRPQGVEKGLAVLEGKERHPFDDDGLTDKQRVEQRIGKEIEGFMVRQHTSHGARGTAAALRKVLREHFTPSADYVNKIPGSAEAIARVFQNAAEARTRPSSVAHTSQAIVPSQQELQRSMGLVNTDICAQSHEIGRRECRFRVDHDADGQAQGVRLTLSSGDAAFDSYAQDVLKRSQATHLTRHSEEPQPVFSEWALAQIVYDWASTPSCFDPNFRPPGHPVYPDSKTPYAVTFTAEVSLLAVRYQ